MRNMTLMCKTHSRLSDCGGYRQRMCDSCYKRDVIMITACDRCMTELNEDNPPHDYEGQELCGECYEKVKEDHNAEF